MRYGQSYGQFQLIPIKVKFYQTSPYCCQNLHKRQQLNLVIDAYNKISFETITQFFNIFQDEIIIKFCE